MPRGRPIRSATLPALLLLAVSMVAALGFLDVRDLVHRHWTEAHRQTLYVPVQPVIAGPVEPTVPGEQPTPWYFRYAVPDGNARLPVNLVQFFDVAEEHSGGVFSTGLPGAKVGWLVGTSLPGTLVALGVLALIGAAVGLARRRGGYSRAVVRLLRAVGFAALVGGPVAALVEYLVAGRSPELSWTPPVDRWVVAVVWVLVGGAFLAVGDLVARAGALRSELDGVI